MVDALISALPMIQAAASWALLILGLFFFISGSLGLLRFPDLYCRLHAVTKADTLGLGCTALAIALRTEQFTTALLLVLVWLLVLAASAVTCRLLARYGLVDEERAIVSEESKPGA